VAERNRKKDWHICCSIRGQHPFRKPLLHHVFDRFGRSLKHLVNSLADLSAYRVAFISLRDNLDLSTPSGRLMFQIIGAMAEFERSLIQERVRAGLRNAILKGKTLGRPRRIVNSDQMNLLREQGASFREIAEAVGASPGTVRTRLLADDLRSVI
jgi:DNA invertase Pin-like site-specific DNA recombinase